MNKLIDYLWGPLFLVSGIVLVVMAQSEGKIIRALDDHGKEAMADVTQIYWKSKGSGSARDFTADFNFVTDIKETVEISGHSIPDSVGRTVRDAKRGQIKVRYLPEDPRKVDFADYRTDVDSYRKFGVALVILGVIATWWKFFRKKSSED
jgi:hypothetical protein